MSKAIPVHLKEDATVMAILRSLRRSTDASAMRALNQICRESVRVRLWLFGRFANDPKVQEDFRHWLDGRPLQSGSLGGAELEEEVTADQIGRVEKPGAYGGVSDDRMWQLLAGCKVGQADAMAVVLVRAWQQLASNDRARTVALWEPTLAFWHCMIRDESGRFLRALLKAKKHALRYSGDSWKVVILEYVLDHPQPSYRVGELWSILPARFRTRRANGEWCLGRREVRRFCQEIGLRRTNSRKSKRT